MWFLPPTRAQREKADAEGRERFLKAMEEARQRQEARDKWVERHTCEHCGQCPPLPPSLM